MTRITSKTTGIRGDGRYLRLERHRRQEKSRRCEREQDDKHYVRRLLHPPDVTSTNDRIPRK